MNFKLIKKLFLFLFLAGVVAVFFILDLNRYFTLSFLKESREQFAVFYAENTALTIAAYMLVYITTVAVSLPGAVIMTLAGGAMFGFVVGVITVSFASTIGASLAFLSSRYLLREWVEKKLGEKLKVINAGIEKEGVFYLIMLRLIHIVPFWTINLLMGLTRMPLITFYCVSQIAMLAATMAYVNAGAELGKVDSLSGILSPGIIASFVILGVFPFVVKKSINWYRVRYRKREGL